ncbi:DNA repair protein REV1 [Lachnellula suecica]|uniref:DNA repair protein REV1 n=1 Tax=Lachnellula suecica TaxID=602035 RepID=A0A8T9BXT2_9HELO|nr:DNA repair protein REV1 [Lachnellula suecica]
MAPPKSTVPPAAQPKHSAYFDAWNSSSTGHQRAENRLGASTGWRQSRNMKLSHQFKSGGTGGKRISDTIGAGSEDWDENAKALIPKNVRQRAKVSVGDMMVNQGASGPMNSEDRLMASRKNEDDLKEYEKLNREKGIFDGLVIYINGSTHPLISDHKLKHILSENGGKLSLHFGRKQVTHVILGRPSGTQGLGSGGGLAGTKIEKEIKKVGGAGIKYVGVEWALESLKAGKRLPETQFSNLKVAAKGQKSVYSMLRQHQAHDH